jgi:LysM repeat protein
MRTWTTSACVMLALSILPIILMAIGSPGPMHPAHASTRTARSTEVILTSLQNAPAAQLTPAKPAVTKYVVQYGDTLSSIAARFAVHGGWPALYAANRPAIGPDPNTIHPGTVLVLRSRTAPVRYTVAAGDTLSGIAARLGLPGGWAALYAANRHVIGPDPNAIPAGVVLTIPRPATPEPASPAPSPATRPHLAPAPPAPAGAAHPAAPRSTGAPNTTGMPTWLKLVVLAVGLLVALTFLTEALLAARRRRKAASRAAPASKPDPLPTAERPCIVLADYDRLVVTCDQQDGRVFVLRPPGSDPRVILRVARLVLPEGSYGELAKQLGVPAIGQVD